jgi:Ca-activated chloride channel family protein
MALGRRIPLVVVVAATAHLALILLVAGLVYVDRPGEDVAAVATGRIEDRCDELDTRAVEDIPPIDPCEEPIEDPVIKDTPWEETVCEEAADADLYADAPMDTAEIQPQIGIGGAGGGAGGMRRRRAPRKEAGAPPSTGGTAEPNGRPYGDVFHRHHGTNPFVDTEEDRLSTFGMDVDTASYAIARRYLRDGHLPDPASVRVEEFVNAFPSDDPAPKRGVFTLATEAMPSRFGGPRHVLLRLGVRARTVAAEDRPPARLTFVVDTSGSMARENRLGLVKRSLMLLVDRLREDDRVALVTYGSEGAVRVPHTGDREVIRRGIRALAPHGSTNAEEGLRLGYGLASLEFAEGAINRVVLCSDGVANVGRTGPDAILKVIAREANRGIELTTLGFGMGNYNDVLMERLADRGNGRYAYLDTMKEARRVIARDFAGMMQTVAKDAKVQVDFDPAVVSRYRLLGYENRRIADRDFRNDAVDAGEVGAGHTVTALYEVKLAKGVDSGDLGTFRIRYRDAEDGRVTEESVPIRRSLLDRKPSRHLLLSAAVAELAEILRGSYWAEEGSLDEVVDALSAAVVDYDRSPRIVELLELARTAARLQKAKGEG